jgi:hypothetical protein
MSRLRRIADRARIFFITRNLLKDRAPLTPSERDLILSSLWFHEVLHPDGTPYRQAEVDLIRQLTAKP